MEHDAVHEVDCRTRFGPPNGVRDPRDPLLWLEVVVFVELQLAELASLITVLDCVDLECV